jgi:hypothetical protein
MGGRGALAGGNGGDSRKRGLRDELRETLEAEVAGLIGPSAADALDFEATETRLRERVLRLAARTLEVALDADDSDGSEPHRTCACGGLARLAGRRPRTIVSVLGKLRVERAYYHCGACGQGFCPRDRALGIEGSHLSPGVLRMVGAVGAAVSFEEGAGLLRDLAGISVPTRQVERYAERLGEEAARFEREVAEAPAGPVPPTMYLGQDGTGVPMRKEELAGRPGKQADGSAKTREMKLCAIWTAEARDRDGRPTRDEGSVTYTAAIEGAETKATDKLLAPFAQRVEREARRRGFDEAGRKVAIGDGAPWLWNIVAECFPGTISDPRQVPRQGARPRRREGAVRRRDGLGQHVVEAPLRGAGRGAHRRAHRGRRRARRSLGGGQAMRRLLHAPPPSDGLPHVRVDGPVRRQRHRRGRLQDRGGRAHEKGRHALERQGRERHRRPAVLPHQWRLR